MKHLSEEQLVEAYYSGPPEEEARHLAECAECRAVFERQREILDAAREYAVPERGPEYGGQVWARLLPRLAKKQDAPHARLWWWLVPAVAALVALGFFAGRWSSSGARFSPIPVEAQQRVLLLSVSEHLERSQILLTELAHADAGSNGLLEERDRARELVGANRLLRQTAERLGDRRDAAVLEDLESVLLEVANAPDEPMRGETARVEQRIAKNELLFKLRISAVDARERGLKL